MSTTLYPLSHFPSCLRNEPECNPIFESACEAAGVDPTDQGTCVTEVSHADAQEAIFAAGNRLPPFDPIVNGYADCFFLVHVIDEGPYGRLVHFPAGALAVPATAVPVRV